MENTKNQIGTAFDDSDARSFPGLEPPNGAQVVGSYQTANDIIYYFQDAEGNLYYESVRGHRFKEEMAAAQKRRRNKRKCTDEATPMQGLAES